MRYQTLIPLGTAGLDDWRRPAALAWTIIIAFFGFGAAWAGFASLDEAAIAPGVVASSTNLKSIQHFEGGIVREILVRDGDTVEAGQVLVRLDPLQAEASAQINRRQLAIALAMEARLISERDQRDAVSFPADVLEERYDPQVARAMNDQVAQFNDRRSNLRGQLDILQARLRQSEEERAGLKELHDSGLAQLDKIQLELAGLESLAAKKLIPLSRVYAMEREAARLKGDIGKAEADMARSDLVASEAKLQIQQLGTQFQEDVGKSLVETRKQIAEMRERLAVANDVLRRVDVTAPIKGVVQGTKVFTVGGVVKPGDTLLEISPTADDLVVRARVDPNDIDSIIVGSKAEISFPAFATRKPPLFMGTVRALSRDRLVDDENKQSYFAAEVVVDPTSVPPYFRQRIVPGMQADAIIAKGERTALEYIVGPIHERLKRSMREH